MKVWWVKIFVIPAETRIKFKIKRRSHYDFSSLFGDPAGVLPQTSQLFYNQVLSKILIKYRTDFVPNSCPVLAVQRLRFSA